MKRSTIVLSVLALAICTSLVIAFLILRPSSSVQSARAVIPAIPTYPGAYHAGYWYSDTPDSYLRSDPRCSIECAMTEMVTRDSPDAVVRFYKHWFISNGWTWADKDVGLHWDLYSRSSRHFREYHFKGFEGPFFGAPWFEAVYEVEDDHHVAVEARSGVQLAHKQYGNTNISIHVYRRQPLPSDTPRPALPTAVPTAQGPALPTVVLTHRPTLPSPVPSPGQ